SVENPAGDKRVCAPHISCMPDCLFPWNPNNLLSDKYVAISHIARYFSKIRVRHCPCLLVPVPPSRRTGVYQEASRQRSPSRHDADHSIVCATPRLYPCVTSDNGVYVPKGLPIRLLVPRPEWSQSFGSPQTAARAAN